MKVSIWLRTEGGESDPHRSVVVLIEIDGDGKWHEVIRGRADGVISHIVENALDESHRTEPK